MFKLWLTIYTILLLTSIAAAQAISDVCVKSTEGKDFWFGFMESRHHQNGHYLELTLTSTHTCNFSMYIGKSPNPYITGVLQPNVPFRYKPPWQNIEPIGSEVVEAKAIHIVSDMPMNIFAMNWSPSSADAAVIFPMDALGDEYYAVCYEPNLNAVVASSGNATGKNSEFLVVATVDNTKVSITPSKVTDKLRPAGVPFEVILNKGEVYQVQSMNNVNLAGQGDLTGSYVKSNKPIAFYSGSYSTTIPINATSAWDHLYEQIPPVRSWGRKYVTVPLKGRSQDVFRIVASVKTNVRIGSNPPIVINKGSFYEFVLKQDQPTVIESDYPILLAQYMVSNIVDKPAGWVGTWDGDPLMLIISPVDQTRENVTFVAYDSPNISSKYFVNVVTKLESSLFITLDGSVINFTTLPNTGYSYAQIPITKGNHNLNSTVPGHGFIAYVYGYGGVESYGYGVGFNLNIKLDLGGDIYFAKDTILLCKGQAKILDAGSHFSKFLWSTGDTTQTIFVTQPGHSWVKATTTDGCSMIDSIYTYLSDPVVKLGNDTTMCNPRSLKLDAGAGFVSYKWNTKDSTRSISVKTQGMYGVYATNKYNCTCRDSAYVFFVDNPKINLGSLDTLICGEKFTTFKITADKGSYQLTSGNPLVQINGLSATVPQFGIYPFSFTATDPYTCVSDTSFKAGFHETPKLNLGRDTTICNPKTITLDAGPGMASYLWNTKDSVRSITVKKPGNYGVQIKSIYGCYNVDNLSVNFADVPRFNFSQLDTLICGVKNTVVDISVDKGELNLSSPDPSVAINGLSTVVPKFGSFPYFVKAKDHYACVSDTTFKLGFHKIPTVVISVDDSTCYGYSLDAKYLGDADPAIARFTWVFAKDTLADEIGKTQIDVKLGMDRTKRDLFLSVAERGCNNSYVIKEINVIPDLDFSVSDTLLCQPFTFSFKATNSENVVDYLWNFGDGSSVHNGIEASHNYTKDGHYTIELTATTDKNCINTVIKDSLLYVAPIPTVGFSMAEDICLGLGPDSLVYVGSGDDKDHYKWDLTSFRPGEIVQNPGETKGPLVFKMVEKPTAEVKLQVISKYGCISEIKSLAMKRIPSFYLQAEDSTGCIPYEIELNAFTREDKDQVEYSWNFGDGKFASGPSVIHTYPDPDNTYDLKLYASSNTTGCKDTLYKPAFLKVFPQQTAAFDFEPKVLSNESSVATFTNQSIGSDHFLWQFDDGYTTHLENPTHDFKVVGPRRILLEAGNEFGCNDTVSNEILIALNRIFPPNAILPNAPNTADREFLPWCNGVLEKGYTLKIVSRWNDLVFECKDQLKGWDGRLKDGTMAPPGNYIWMLYFQDFQGKFHNQHGTVTLIY